jgi:DNA-binding CsgD family transcriptional regulator
VDLLARELNTQVVAWRIDPASEVVWLSATSGLGSARRAKLEATEVAAMVGGDRVRLVRWLHDRAVDVFGRPATIVDGGVIVIAAGGHNAELELCGRELASLLEQLPEATLPSIVAAGDGPATNVSLARLQDLTPREREILSLLASGAGTSEIAKRLVISDKTVKTHVQNILRKLDVTSRLEAAAVAIRAGYVSLSAS